MALLLLDEVLHLLLHKHSGGRMEPTCLDRVISAWQEVFPDSRILRESGRLLFSRKEDDALTRRCVCLTERRPLTLYVWRRSPCSGGCRDVCRQSGDVPPPVGDGHDMGQGRVVAP